MKAPVSNQKADNTGIAFVTRKVVTETTQVSLAPVGGYSLGQMLDDHLREAAKRGDVIESVDLQIAPELWEIMTQRFNGQARPEDMLSD